MPWPRYSVRDPFPSKQSVKLTYSDLYFVTAGSSGTFGTEQGFRLNSLYDPDYVKTGHQPYFFDTLAAIYNRYMVRACTIDITFSDPTADGVVCACQVKPNSATGGVTNLAGQLIDAARERPNVVMGFCNNTGGQKCHIRRRFTIPEAEGIEQRHFEGAISQYSALVSANPTYTPYLQVAAACVDGAATPTVRYSLILTFEVDFWERTIVAQS